MEEKISLWENFLGAILDKIELSKKEKKIILILFFIIFLIVSLFLVYLWFKIAYIGESLNNSWQIIATIIGWFISLSIFLMLLLIFSKTKDEKKDDIANYILMSSLASSKTPEERDEIMDIYDVLNEWRDYTKYRFKHKNSEGFSGWFSKRKFVYNIIKDYIEVQKADIENLEKLNLVASHRFNVWYYSTDDKVKNNPTRFFSDTLIVANKEISICNQWALNTILPLIEYFDEKWYIIEDNNK